MFKWNESFQAKLDELIVLNEKGKLEGEYNDIPLEVYHHPMCPGFSKSMLKEAVTYNRLTHYLKKRLEQINDPNAEPEEKSKEMMIGSAVDSFLFEPERAGDLYVKGLEIPDFGDKRKKANKEKYEEWTMLHYGPWLEKNQGKLVLTPKVWDQVQGMVHSAKSHPEFKKVVDGGEFQVTYFYRYTKDGHLFRTRPDIVNKKKRLVYDHKTTHDAEMGAFKRTAKNFSYDLQLAMQVDAANRVLGGDQFLGLWGAQDRDVEPYDMAFYTPDDPSMDSARNWLAEKMTYLENAKQGTVSKGYSHGVTTIGITGWVLT